VIELAHEAIAVLAPFLSKGIEEAVKELGKDAAASIASLMSHMKRKLTKPASLEALDDFSLNPTDLDVQGQMRMQLSKELEADPEFRAAVQQLVRQAQSAAHSHSSVQTASVTGSNSDIFQVSGHGNVIKGRGTA